MQCGRHHHSHQQQIQKILLPVSLPCKDEVSPWLHLEQADAQSSLHHLVHVILEQQVVMIWNDEATKDVMCEYNQGS